MLRVQFDRIGGRIAANQNAPFSYDRSVADHIVKLCNGPDFAGRIIDKSVTNSLMPDPSPGGSTSR